MRQSYPEFDDHGPVVQVVHLHWNHYVHEDWIEKATVVKLVEWLNGKEKNGKE